MPSLDSIQHFFFLMLENRSFDHILGHLSLKAFGARSDVDGLRGEISPDGILENPAYRNLFENEVYRPHLLLRDTELRTDLPHSRAGTDVQVNLTNGMFGMDGFAAAYFRYAPFNRVARCPALAVMTPTLVPMTTFLATEFRVCDRWFASIPTETHPNRLISLAGYTLTDANKVFHQSHDLVIDWMTRKKIPWRFYGGNVSFVHTMRQRSFFDNNKFRSFSRLASDFRDMAKEFPSVTFIEPNFSDDFTNSEPNDNHPPLPVSPGEALLRRAYKAISESPRWKDSMLIVYYDEHGGFLDHVPPLALATPAPKGATFPAFTTTGLRVPAIVVSPYTQRDQGQAPLAAFGENLDHTSILRMLADRFTPGNAYSVEVETRAASGDKLGVLQNVLGTTRIAKAPGAPDLGNLLVTHRAGDAPPRTESEKAFAAAGERLVKSAPKDVAKANPEFVTAVADVRRRKG